jgi:pyruvate kinase
MTTMGLLWGVKVFYYDPAVESVEKTVQGMVDRLKNEGLLEVGDVFVTTLSIPAHTTKKTNTVQLGTVE